ncbi:MAG: hypothetical protein J1F41_02120, partial [Lachnospiraceae bacterium]|nr:hypothetical protein [Lachnospiraceae bacterium]
MKEYEWKTKIKLNVLSIILAVAGTLCFPQILNLKENMLGFTNSIFSVIFWILCFYAVKSSLYTIDIKDNRGWKIAGILSFLFTTAMLFGTRLDRVGNVDFKDFRFWVSLPVLTCLFAVLIRKAWHMIGDLEEKQKEFEVTVRSSRLSKTLMHLEKHINNRANLLTFVFLILCWLPVFLAVYPGFFVYDAQDEFLQVASRTFNTHHPLVHVLLLGGIISAVHKITDSYNLGIACYIILQMLVVAGCFTYLLSYLRKKKVSRWLRLLAIVYFAFFPVIVMFTLCSAKDAIFTAALLLLLVSMLEMGISEDTFFSSKPQMLFFVLSALTMLLFRKNGVYAFLVMVPVLLIGHKKYWKKMGILLAIAFCSYFLIDGGMTTVLHAQNGENQEILTVPIQQLARTYKFNKEAFGEEDVATLHEILPEEALALYNPKLSDPVKYYFDNAVFAKNKSKYMKLWLKIGMRKPLSYINAWLANSYGFWYSDTVIDVYSGNTVFTFTYEDSSYFGYEVEMPGIRESKISWLNEAYRKLSLEIEKEKVPILSMLYSPGFLFWCFAFMFGYILYRKKYHILIPCLLVLLVWLTVILGPTYLPRYVLIFWFGLPLFAAILLEEGKFS